MTDSPIPSAPLAEKKLISICIQEPENWIPKLLGDGITAEFFYPHKDAWNLILDRFHSGKSLDPIHVWEEEKATSRLEAIGGMAGFTELMTFSPGVPGDTYTYDLGLLREAAARRTAYLAGIALQETYNGSDVADTVETVESLLATLQSMLTAPQGMITAHDAGQDFYRRLIENYENGDIPGHSTGIAMIDEASGGARKGELWVIGAETSGGKSVLMIQIMRAILEAGHPALLFTLELMAPEVIGRLCAIHGRIPYGEITKPRSMSQHVMGRLKGVVEEIKGWPLWIQDKGGQTISEIVGDCMRYQDTKGQIGVVVVDYLQMIEFDASSKRGMNRQQELAAISRRLKALAKELKCTVITATQLNDDGKIRESRDASFDADNVLFIAEEGIIAKKMRNAKRGMTMPLRLNGNFQRFEEFVPEPKATKPKSSRQYADF